MSFFLRVHTGQGKTIRFEVRILAVVEETSNKRPSARVRVMSQSGAIEIDGWYDTRDIEDRDGYQIPLDHLKKATAWSDPRLRSY